MRMLEQKISDAGPNPQRIDPHVLTKCRNSLTKEGRLATRTENKNQWHFLTESDADFVENRFRELVPFHALTESHAFTSRMGQTAEIAVQRAMQTSKLHFFGHFSDLQLHDDSTLYTKLDPDFFSGIPILGGKLDYIVVNPDVGGIGIEIKNTREWVYPDKSIVKHLLDKCVQIDVVPVLMARRIHYSTFSVLNACGVVIHQFYNQLYPSSDASFAKQISEKNNLGYFDVRVGNNPDARLLRFFQNSLPVTVEDARSKFNEHKPLIGDYVQGNITYSQFVSRLRGRDEEDDAEPF